MAALRAGEYMLVKASIAGAIVTNALFMLGASPCFWGGLRHHVQEYNRAGGRLSFRVAADGNDRVAVAVRGGGTLTSPGMDVAVHRPQLSAALAVLLIVAYGLSLVFSLRTHKKLFASGDHGEAAGPCAGRSEWPSRRCLVVTVLVALVSEIFVELVQKAAETLGMTPACLRRLHRGCPGWRRRRDGCCIFRGSSGQAGYEREYRIGVARPRSLCSSHPCWCCSAISSGLCLCTCNSGRAR